MQRLIYILLGLLAFSPLFSQVSNKDKINYQAVVFDATGDIMTNTSVSVKVSLLADSETGDVVYSETHFTITDKSGMLTLDIGGGTTLQGEYDTINWVEGKFFLKTEIDLEGGTNYFLTGIQNLVSVPLALHAKSMVEMDPVFSNSLVSSIMSSDTMAWNNKQNKVIAGEGITISGDTIRLDAPKSSPAHYIGELYGGGVIFWLDDTGEHGLVVGMEDLSDAFIWSNVAWGIYSDTDWDFDGANNTLVIINQPGHTSSAAQLCADYTNVDYGTGVYDDWYLPSVSEFNYLYSRLFEVQKALESAGNDANIFKPFRVYWSSTQFSNTQVLGFNFYAGFSTNSKADSQFVRPIRAF